MPSGLTWRSSSGDEDHLDLLDVGIHRDQVFGEVVVDVAGAARGRSRSPRAAPTTMPQIMPAHQLAARGARVDDAAGGEGADDARHADLAGARDAPAPRRTRRRRRTWMRSLHLGAAGQRRLAPIELLQRVRRHAVRDVLGIGLDRAVAGAADRVFERLAAPSGARSVPSPAAAVPGRCRRAGRPGAAAAPAMRARICSQALATTLQTLAVVLEPPATGAGGRSLSPISTLTLSSGTPSRSAAVCAMTV